MERQRLVLTKQITALGMFPISFRLEIYEPYKHRKQNRENPNSRYSAKVWHAKEKGIYGPRAVYENLTPQEAFKDLPDTIFEQWGYRKERYVQSLNEYPWRYTEHPWEIRKRKREQAEQKRFGHV